MRAAWLVCQEYTEGAHYFNILGPCPFHTIIYPKAYLKIISLSLSMLLLQTWQSTTTSVSMLLWHTGSYRSLHPPISEKRAETERTFYKALGAGQATMQLSQGLGSVEAVSTS